MTVFWLLVAVMATLALLFIIPPLLRNRQTEQIDRNLLTAAVIKEQLAELDADLASGKLDQTAYSAARQDLERSLLDDIDDTALDNESPGRSGRWAAVLLAVALPVTALSLYHKLGTQQFASGNTEPAVAAASSEQATMHSIASMVGKLEARLQDKPDDPEGWYMLAKSYAVLNQFDKSAAAYRQLLKLTGDQPDLLADYADTLTMVNGGTFTDEAGELLKKSLQLQPDNIKALWLMGHWYYQHNDLNKSLELWSRAAALLPPGDENAVALNQQIQLVRQKLGMPAAAPVQTAVAKQSTAAPASDSSIEVSVSLDPALQNKAAPDDTVFIFARAVKGPRMPLAIVRKQVKDLPVTVKLDDSLAMSAQMVLSKFPEVSIGARISKSGNAIPASGDLSGSVSPVATDQNKSVTVVISEVVP